MAEPRLIKVLANAQAVINVLAEEAEYSHADVADAVGIPRSTVYRLAEGLSDIGLVEIREGSMLALSERWLQLADVAAKARPEWANAQEALARLQERTGQTAYLSVPRDGRAMCVAWLPGEALGVLLLKPGRWLPYHVGAAGRTLLAFGDMDVDDYVARGDLNRYTSRTLTTVDALRADGQAVRELGYAVSDEDVTKGIGALGVPVYDDRGAVAAAVSIGGLAEEFRSRQAEFVDALRVEVASVEVVEGA